MTLCLLTGCKHSILIMIVIRSISYITYSSDESLCCKTKQNIMCMRAKEKGSNERKYSMNISDFYQEKAPEDLEYKGGSTIFRI